MLGNYTCSALTARGSADHTVLVSTENLLFPLTAPSHVRSRQGWAANCSNTLDRKYGSIVLLRSHHAQSHSKIQQRQQFFFPVDGTFHSQHLPGSRAEFRCEVSSGVGEVSYLWTFNNTDISQLDQFTNRTSRLSFGSQLVITDLRLEDSGQIGCEASNNLSVSRHLADLSVTRAGLERKVSLGEKTSLACPLGGDSEAVISWLRDSQLVSSHPVLADGSLLIKAVAPSDLGEYLCQADHLRLGEQGRAERE